MDNDDTPIPNNETSSPDNATAAVQPDAPAISNLESAVGAGEIPVAAPVIYATPVVTTRPVRPRIWSALLAPVVGLAVSAMLQIPVFLKFVDWNAVVPHDRTAGERINRSVLQNPTAILWLALVAQLSFGGVTIVAATRSKESFRQRLGFVRPAVPIWGWPLFLAGSLFIMMLMLYAIQSMPGEPSEQLKAFAEAKLGAAGWMAVAFFLVVNLMPGFFEEMLFRGYLQRRLLARWHALPAILVSTVMFALAHIDPQHMVIALWLGLWLGLIAWRTGSIWPGIFTHAGTNALGIVIILAAGVGIDDKGPVHFPIWMWLVLGGAFMAAVGLLVRARPLAKPIVHGSEFVPAAPYPADAMSTPGVTPDQIGRE